ncbi:MAG: dihydrodipicolinate synthase family protein [Acidobacteria bacterium]|nr:dihydrodipicolinate synthase family protein [Acidobacteriota bacterium]
MLRLDGITPVMFTPFLEDERIDEASLRRQIDFAIAAGAAAICGPGFGSEFYKMSDEERHRFAEILVNQARKRVPVIVATSSDSTFRTIEFSRFAERISADCVMVTPPRTSKLPTPEIVEFYSRLCNRLTIPVMLQDADFTGAGLPASVFVDLAKKHENFLFTKLEIILPGQKCAEIIERTGGRVQVIYGLGGIAMMDGLFRGASAFMPGAAVLEVYVQTYQLYKAGRKDEAEALFSRLLPYLAFALQHLELAVGMEKRAMARRGIIPHHRMRHPTLSFDPAGEQQIEQLVTQAVNLANECRAPAVVG